MDETATPSGATVDAPASMDSVLAEFETGGSAGTTEQEVVKELVETTTEGDAQEAADPETGETEAGDKVVESDVEPEKSEDAPDPTHKVKVNGEEVEVPLSELLKGYSRERDYTTKTQALAEERKALASTWADAEANHATQLRNAIEQFKTFDPILSEAANIDWQALAQEDPATYTQLRAAVDARQEAVSRWEAEARESEQASAGARQKLVHDLAQRQVQKLIERMPELTEAGKGEEFANGVTKYLTDAGFTPDERADMVDHRAWIIIDKARRFDAIEAAKKELPARKVVQQSAAKPLRTDAGSSQPTRPRLSPNASRDQRVAHVVNQFLEG